MARPTAAELYASLKSGNVPQTPTVNVTKRPTAAELYAQIKPTAAFKPDTTLMPTNLNGGIVGATAARKQIDAHMAQAAANKSKVTIRPSTLADKTAKLLPNNYTNYSENFNAKGEKAMGGYTPLGERLLSIPISLGNTISAPATALRAAIPMATNKFGNVSKPDGYYSLMNMISDLSGKNIDKAIQSVPVVGGGLDIAANIVGDTLTDPTSLIGAQGIGNARQLYKIGKAGALEDALNSATSVKRAAELASASKLFNGSKAALAANAVKSATPIIENGKRFDNVVKRNLGEVAVQPSAALPNTLLPKVDNIAVKVENPSTVAQSVSNGIPEGNVAGFGKNTVGAAEQASTKTKDLIDKYGQIETGTNPTRIMQIPNRTADNMAVSKFSRTVGESGNLTDAQAIRIEQKAVDGNYSHLIKTDVKAVASADKVISEEGISGATRQWERATSGTKIVTKEDMALAQQLLTQAYARGDIAGAERLVSQLTIEGTRSGQISQSMSLFKKMTPQGKLFYLQKYVDKTNSDLFERLGDKAIKIEISPELGQQMLAAKSLKEIADVEKQIVIEIAKQTPSTWGDKMNAWRYLSMLGNPLTHLRNIYGNLFFMPIRKFSSVINTGLEKAFKVEVGNRTSAVFIPFSKADKATKAFAKSDYNEIGDILHGNKFNENSSIIRDNQPIFVSKNKTINTILKPLEGARKGNFGLLGAEDTLFSKSAYIDYMSQYMKSNKYTAKFLSSGTDEAISALEKGREHSILQAQKATFNEANSFATWVNKQETKLLTKGPIGKIGYMAIEGVVPFKKTPANIVKRGLEYSPLNLIKAVTADLIKVKSGKIEATDAIRHASEGLTGTALLGLGAFLSAQGIITGKVDTTGKAQSFDSQNGVQQYSLNIGNYSYTINWLAPEIMPVMMGSELYQSFIKDKPQNLTGGASLALNHVLSAMSSITDPVFELTMLQGVNNLFTQSFGSSAMQQIQKTIPGFLGQFNPTIGGQITRTMQPNRKNTATSDPVNSLLGINKNIAKVPFLSNALPDKLDLWGQPVSNGGIAQRAITNFLSPGYIGTKQTDSVNTEVQRLYDATNDTSALPSSAPNLVKGSNGKSYYMTPEEKTKYQQTMGQAAKKGVTRLLNNSQYTRAKDYVSGTAPDKLSMITKAYATAKQVATAEFLKSRGVK